MRFDIKAIYYTINFHVYHAHILSSYFIISMHTLCIQAYYKIFIHLQNFDGSRTVYQCTHIYIYEHVDCYCGHDIASDG